jgi:DNA-binding NarL/FixJ family response regulator
VLELRFPNTMETKVLSPGRAPQWKPRLLIADDHTLVLQGIRKLLENDFELVGAVEDGRALLRKAPALRPDVILLDISMPLLNGIDACRQLVKSLRGLKVVFLTMHSERVYLEEALRAGGSGYLLKNSAAAELTEAINAVIRGERYITSRIDWSPAASNPSETGSAQLTPRQREVLQLIAEGRANKEIAALMHLSEKTVEYHKCAIRRELMLSSTAELTQFAVKHRIIGTYPSDRGYAGEFVFAQGGSTAANW